MRKFSEAETQVLIAVGWLKSRYGLMSGFDSDSNSNAENLRKFGKAWFGKYLVDWSDAFQHLADEDYLSEINGLFVLTEKGKLAGKAVEIESPLWLYEYNNFFSEAANSPAHALFCKNVYGRNLCQHGLADIFQLDKLLDVLRLKTDDRVIDLGCGNGFITEYLQNETGAFFEA
jgi:hypothetical protein